MPGPDDTTAGSRPAGRGSRPGNPALVALVAALLTLVLSVSAPLAEAARGPGDDGPATGAAHSGAAGGAVTAAVPGVPARPRVWLVRTTAVLTWAAVPGAVAYRVLNHSGRAVWAGTARTTTRSAMRPGGRYGFRVQAVGPHGGRSAPSAQTLLAVPPAVPGGVVAVVSAAGVTLRWDRTAGAIGFRIAADDATGHPTGAPRSAPGRSASLSWLAPGSTSGWSVAAIAANGTGSAWSTPVRVTAPTATPATPLATVSTGSTGPGGARTTTAAVTLSWPAVPGAAGYALYNHTGRRVRTVTATRTTIGRLQPGTRYTWSLASVNSARFVSPQSTAVTVVTPRLPDPAVTTRSLTWGGLQRTYLVATSTGATTGATVGGPVTTSPAPAIVLLHGLGDTAADVLATTRILQPALAAGMVVIAPESIGGIWNDGRLDAPGRPGRDDVGFVLAAVDALVARGVVDPDRVTMAGYSNGAGLAMRIAAADPGRVAELVSFSGALISDGRALLPTAPVPTVLVHGDADTIQPWAGRPQLSPELPAQYSQPVTSRIWRLADGETGQPAATVIEAPAWDPGLAATLVQRWTAPAGTAGTAPFTFYRVVGGQHRWSYEPCAPATNTGCSADDRTDAQAEPFDATALLVSVAATAHTLTAQTLTAQTVAPASSDQPVRSTAGTSPGRS